jgi:site-specific DNA-methyltransferase (adenine-specific)
MNHLYYGDNLSVLRDSIRDESVDLIYLDPPFNSNASYNVLFKGPAGTESAAQIEAFDDTWHWNDSAEEAFGDVMRGGNTEPKAMPRRPSSVVKDSQLKKHRMRSFFLFAGIATCFSLTSAQSFASTEELERPIYKVIPFSGEPYVSLDVRQAYVRVLIAYWSSFDSRVPRLSPAESDWIEQELGAQGERLTRSCPWAWCRLWLRWSPAFSG